MIDNFEFENPELGTVYFRKMSDDDLTDRELSHNPEAWTASQLKDSLHSNHLCYVFECNRECLGFLVFSSVLDELEILMVFVKRRYRGLGLAYSVLQSVFTRTQNSARSALLEVRESNNIAIELYEKLGFQQQGRRKKYYRALDSNSAREDALVMSLQLA